MEKYEKTLNFQLNLENMGIWRKVWLNKSLILTNEDCERIDNWWQSAIDEDGYYDKTIDRIFLKRFKKEYPKQYKVLIKAIQV